VDPTVVPVSPLLTLSHDERESMYVWSPGLLLPRSNWPVKRLFVVPSPTPIQFDQESQTHQPSASERHTIPFVTTVPGPCPMTGPSTAILILPRRNTGPPTVATKLSPRYLGCHHGRSSTLECPVRSANPPSSLDRVMASTSATTTTTAWSSVQPVWKIVGSAG